MGALKTNKVLIKEWIEDFRQACKELVDAIFNEGIEEYDDMNTDVAVNKAINETIKENPGMSEELMKIAEAINYEQDRLSKQAENQFNTSKTFGIELDRKDADGYNKIPDKLDDIGAEVSEAKAAKGDNGRRKEGKQRTRVDED